MSRRLDPQTPPEKAFRGSKHLVTRYLGDFGRLGKQLSDEMFHFQFLGQGAVSFVSMELHVEMERYEHAMATQLVMIYN